MQWEESVILYPAIKENVSLHYVIKQGYNLSDWEAGARGCEITL